MRENKVTFVGTLEKEMRAGKGFKGEATISMFLKGDTSRGQIFIPVKASGFIAEKILEKSSSWTIGDEFIVEGELDWESYKKKDGEKRYQTIIAVKSIHRIEGV